MQVKPIVGIFLTRGFTTAFTLNQSPYLRVPRSCSVNMSSGTTHSNAPPHGTSIGARDADAMDNDHTATCQGLIFGRFKISPSQIFYHSTTQLTSAIVNLRPIVPGHVLVIPQRVVPKLSQLTTEEYDDLWRSVRIVQNALEKHYDAGGFNVAVQDGKEAGQSVPHVHVHILPRIKGDFERNDDVYDALEDWAPTDAMVKNKMEDKNKMELNVPDDEDRVDRTMGHMEDEARLYRTLLLNL